MIKVDNKNKLFAVIIIAVSFVIIIPNIPNSYAHAFVTKSDPEASQSLSTPPSKVDVYFSDPVDIRYSEVKVLDSDGKQIQENDQHYINGDQLSLSVSLPPNLPNGIYTISTKVLDQTDGHVTEDAFAFGVGQDVPKSIINNLASNNYQEVSIPEAVARFPSLLGQVIVAGIASSSLWLWGPISRIPRFKDSIFQTRIKIDSAMAKMAVIGSIIILASGFAMIIVQAFSINAGILDAISTKFGNMWTLRMIAASVLLILSFVIYQKTKKTPTIIPKAYTVSLLGVSFLVLLTTSLISHGAATGQIIPLLLDFCHNVFASLWIGGVIYLAFIVMPQIKQITDFNLGLSAISLLNPRFSILVVTVLGAVVITGPFLLYALENNLPLTLASFYGKVLIIKLSLATAMIALGGYHQVFVSNKAHSIISKGTIKNTATIQNTTTNAKQILSRFDTSIKIEAFIGIALIASVAVLVDSGLPSSEFQNQLQSLQSKVFALTTNDNSVTQGLSQTGFIENGSRVVLSMSPFATGGNDFTISFLDSNKNPIDMKSAQLKLTQTDSGIGPITVDTNKTGTGTFTTNTDFGFPGHWTVRVEGVQNKENSLNLVYSYDMFVKPKLNNVQVDIKEYKTPGNSTPRYPVYDSSRNKIWVGDTTLNSGKILDFDLGTDKYTVHKIDGLNSAVYTALDSQNTLWYIDYTRKMLGHYNPDDNSSKEYSIPDKDFLTGMAIDNNDTVWITSTNLNTFTADVLKFNINTTKFDSIKLPDKSDPLGITIDNTIGKIWIAEGIGKISSLDISNNKVTEFAPLGNYTMKGPTAIIVDPQTGKVYISEHEGQAVSVFDPLLKTFKKIQLDPNPNNLPYGMAFDEYHNLWVAQHTIDKISIIDPKTGDVIEKNIPSHGALVQWVTSDSQGNIIMGEENASALAIATISAGQPQNNQADIPSVIPKFGFDYVQIVAPSMTGLLVVVSFIYCKGVIDLRKATNQVRETFKT
ncbi:MAG: copper resistance CopC/CopD family protein [Nitrosotalea sp.]